MKAFVVKLRWDYQQKLRLRAPVQIGCVHPVSAVTLWDDNADHVMSRIFLAAVSSQADW